MKDKVQKSKFKPFDFKGSCIVFVQCSLIRFSLGNS